MAEQLHWQDQNYSATVGASGAGTLTIAPKGVQQWLVRQVSWLVTTVVPSVASVNLKKNGRQISQVTAQRDEIGGEPPVLLRPGDTLTLEYTGLTAGQVINATALYDIIPWGE